MRSLSDHRHCDLLRDRRVLVVEDEALVAMLIEEYLIEAGAEVVGPAATVEQALSLIQQAASGGGLSAAVLDINMNGDAVSPVAEKLSALGVPFVFATGYAGPDLAGTPPAPTLMKPFAPGQLARAVIALTAAAH